MKEFSERNIASGSAVLEKALLFTIAAHAAAMASMLLLLPGIPGGLASGAAQRAAYVSRHPWLWRLGWLPWQITALSDLLLAAALLKTRWIARLPASLTLLATVAGILPDQISQYLWTWVGPSLAAAAGRVGDYANYASFEATAFKRIAGWGTIGYLAAALGWTWCFARAGVWSKRLMWLSVVLWPLFAIATAPLMLMAGIMRSPRGLFGLSLGNAIAFVLLMIWLFAVTERVLRLRRPDTLWGRFAPFRYSARGPFGRACGWVANSRAARALGEWVPALAMVSDITNVVYVNYLVEADRLDPLVERPLELQRLGPDGRYALFTFLTFRHGHFAPRCFGPLRRLWPSPIQSNWRIHVTDPYSGRRGIQFLTIAISTAPYALIARLVAENVPMHVPASAFLNRAADDAIELVIDPASGSAPDARVALRPCEEPSLGPPWNLCFSSWRDMLAYCVPQDRALSSQPWRGCVTRQEIALDIPLESCQPLKGNVRSHAARAIVNDAEPQCFYVEKVQFRLFREQSEKVGGERVPRET